MFATRHADAAAPPHRMCASRQGGAAAGAEFAQARHRADSHLAGRRELGAIDIDQIFTCREEFS